MTRLRGFNNMYTCEWNQASFAPDLEENHISAVLTISKSKLPKMSLDFYTELGIQHYTGSIADLKDAALEEAAMRIARIIHHFVSNGQRILIRSNEDSGVSFSMIFYLIWAYYHNNDGTKKENLKKPDMSITTQAINEIKAHRIETDLDIGLTQKLYAYENRINGSGN